MKGFKSFATKTEVPFSDGFNCVLGPNGSGKCLTGDAQVQLANGRVVSIQQLVDQHEKRSTPMDDGWMALGDGTSVLAVDKRMRLIKKPIQAFVKRTAPKTLLRIQTKTGRSVTATPYHPLFGLKNGTFTALRADELTEGMRIATPRTLPVQATSNVFYELLDLITTKDSLYVPNTQQLQTIVRERKKGTWKETAKQARIPYLALKSFLDGQAINVAYLIKLLRWYNLSNDAIIEHLAIMKGKSTSKTLRVPWNNSKEFSRFLGLILAEGRLTKNGQVWFVNGTEEIVKEYYVLTQKLFGAHTTINEYKPRAWDVITYSKPLITLLKHFGVGQNSGDKSVAGWYFGRANNNELSALLSGLYDGDGYVSHNTIQLTTKSPKLAHAVNTALLRLGIIARTQEIVKIATNTGFSGVYQQVSVYGSEQYTSFAEKISLLHPLKQERLRNAATRKTNPNHDLLEVNELVRQAVKEQGIAIKPLRKQFPRLEAYVYNQCLPTRQGVALLLEKVFTKQTRATKQLTTVCASDLLWDEVVSIEEITPKDPWVYDLCVEEHHNFIANNIVVHNSNILDSLCFVLGKSGSKSLRAEKTANLIYNGGKSKKAAKQGEVHIYFDNTSGVFPVKEKEIKISRIVKASGQSDYKINDETRTRTEITDLLAHARINPDGYNIILQGDIVKLVEMSPNERRTIIEEISGINIYEEKKAKAARELERVDQQLKEAEIVLAERKTYLTELKKERDQALKFRELDEKIKRNKKTINHRKQEEREKKIAELEEKMASEREGINTIQDLIDDLKKQILEKKRQADEVARELEEKGGKEEVQITREVEELKVGVALKKQRQQQLNTELERINKRKQELTTSQKDTKDRIERLQKEIQTAEKKISTREKDRLTLEKKVEEFRKKNDLEGAAQIDSKIADIDKNAENLQEELGRLREQQQELLRNKDKLEFRIQTIDEKVNKVLEAQKENKQQLQVLKAKRTELTRVLAELNTALDRGSSIVPEIQTAKGKLESRRDQLSKLRARQLSIQERMAGSVAVKKILEMRAKNKKIYGTVAELGSASSEHGLALEIAAGARARSIVVEDDQTAQECIHYLKSHQLGVATFLPLNKLSARTIPTELRTLKISGVHGLALDLVQYDKRFEKAFQHVLGSTLVVQDVTAARKVGVGKTRMVTLDGDLIESSGAMTGGYRARKQGAGAAFQEQELSGKLGEIEKEVADYESIVSRLTSEQQGLDTSIQELRERRHQLEDEVSALERELHIDSADIDASQEDKKKLRVEAQALEKDIDEIIMTVSAKNKELGRLKMEKHSLREKITQLRSPQLLAEMNTFDQQRQRIGEEIVAIRTEMQGLKNQISSVHQPELENITKILDQHDKENKGFLEEQEQLKKEVKEDEATLKEKEKGVEQFRKQYKALFETRSKLQEEVTKLEEKTIREEEKIRKAEHTLNASSIQMAQLKAELAGLKEEGREYEGIEPFKTKALEDIMAEIKQFERMVQDMGAVNMKALEMYERVETEYNTLVNKKETLSGEREDVLLMINEIDARKRELFMRTFEAIEEQFKSIFASLSSKGEAFLELEDPEDPFAAGLNIRVRLSGTKFMDIRSLSGGEKTMTALAFLFAIQEHQPASFYVLDEVDAALDKKNSERLARLVREYCDEAQYIIISHNDGVISEADTLFGVSMNEHGESQVTSLKI